MNDDIAARVARAPRAATLSLAGLGLLGALAGCAGDADAMPTGTSSPSSSASPDSGSTGSSDAPAEGSDAESVYADGSYTEDGEYQSPGGNESITVSITLEDDLVTGVTVTPHATSGNAKQFQTQFASGIAGEVVGKAIDSLEVSRVAGSSLTSGGFNDALEKIKADASA